MHSPIEGSISGIWRALRSAPVQPDLWLSLVKEYVILNLNWQSGYAARQAFRCNPELKPRLDAMNLGSWQDTPEDDAVLGLVGIATCCERIALFQNCVQENPGDWLTWLYLSRLLEMSSKKRESLLAMAKAQALEAISGETLHWIGVWRLRSGDAQGAVDALSPLIDICPIRYGSMMYLGEALLRIGNTQAAESALTRASLSPNPDFLQLLASRVFAQNYWQEAISILDKALAIRPEVAPRIRTSG